jgi:dephospho-CoA kinase
MTPAGIADLTPEHRADSVVIYLDVSEETRRMRLSSRIDGDDVNTRLENDRKDFENFTDFDIRIENSDF